jgi:hypothetical protein
MMGHALFEKKRIFECGVMNNKSHSHLQYKTCTNTQVRYAIENCTAIDTDNQAGDFNSGNFEDSDEESEE